VANLVCEVEGVPLFDLDTILGFFKDDVVRAMTPTISKALNKLLEQETPLPKPGVQRVGALAGRGADAGSIPAASTN
jgi:hypothetical protein